MRAILVVVVVVPVRGMQVRLAGARMSVREAGTLAQEDKKQNDHSYVKQYNTKKMYLFWRNCVEKAAVQIRGRQSRHPVLGIVPRLLEAVQTPCGQGIHGRLGRANVQALVLGENTRAGHAAQAVRLVVDGLVKSRSAGWLFFLLSKKEKE